MYIFSLFGLTWEWLLLTLKYKLKYKDDRLISVSNISQRSHIWLLRFPNSSTFFLVLRQSTHSKRVLHDSIYVVSTVTSFFLTIKLKKKPIPVGWRAHNCSLRSNFSGSIKPPNPAMPMRGFFFKNQLPKCFLTIIEPGRPCLASLIN